MSFLQVIPPALVVLIVSFAAFFFYRHYVVKARKLAELLRWLQGVIDTVKIGDTKDRKAALNKIFKGLYLETTWTEYANTLHSQVPLQGEQDELTHRATLPPELFFSSSGVIDRPLNINYFRHLPGILTGVGILGTFGGLLIGLSMFNPSNSESIGQGLGLLLTAVRDAFFASGLAIAAAMAITHFEKLFYTRCLRELEALNLSLRKMFRGGIELEYMAQIAQGHELMLRAQMNQTKQREESVSESLKPIFQSFFEVQRATAKETSEAFAQAMTESNNKLAAQIELGLQRQLKASIDVLSSRILRSVYEAEDTDSARIKKLIGTQRSKDSKVG